MFVAIMNLQPEVRNIYAAVMKIDLKSDGMDNSAVNVIYLNI